MQVVKNSETGGMEFPWGKCLFGKVKKLYIYEDFLFYLYKYNTNIFHMYNGKFRIISS